MSETKLDPRDRLAVMVSMAGSYIESGRGDDALAVMRTVAEDVATELARLTRELEEARELLRELAGGDEAGLAWDRGWRCVYCDSSALYVVSHDGDCPIVRARRALATDMEGQP